MKENRLGFAKKILILEEGIPVCLCDRLHFLQQYDPWYRAEILHFCISILLLDNSWKSLKHRKHCAVGEPSCSWLDGLLKTVSNPFLIPIIKKISVTVLGRYPNQNDPTIRASCRIWPFSCFIRLARTWETFLLRSEKLKTNTVFITYVIPHNIIFSRCNRL